MAMTPEGRIKIKIKKLLDSYAHHVYYFMPVQTGYGNRTVDFLGCICGVFFAIEAKKPGAVPTAIQNATLERIREAGGMTFVVRDDESLAVLKRYLDFANDRVEVRVTR
jgi:hypothetical protein